VTDIGRGVGFTTAVRVSRVLDEVIQSLQNKIDGGYDQGLYDVLWMAHSKLSLDQSQYATFNVSFQHKDGKTGMLSEIGFRLRVEVQKQAVWLGLMEDVEEAA
jgi:hypothetical protein